MGIGSIIGGVVSAGASLIGGSNNSKAIKKASAAQAEATAQNTALQRDIYAQNKGALAPFMERGNVAGNAINALLGLGGSAATSTPQEPTYTYSSPTAQDALAYILPEIGPKRTAQYNRAFASQPDATAEQRLRYIQGVAHGGEARMLAQYQGQQIAHANPVAPITQPAVSPQAAATDAYNIFKQSTGYQSRLNEGYRALNSGYAGRGLVQSGAAQKALLQYGQNQASNEFGNYLGYLGNQQGVGLSGASALAGVGQSYANNVGALNQNQAQFAGQAAVAQANNSNQLVGGIAGSLSNVLGGFGGGFGGLSSYGGTPPYAGTGNYYNPRTTF